MAKAKPSSRAPEAAAPELPRIHTVRKQKVMLDSELAALFGVETKVFNQAIRRNLKKFPSDFAFCLTREELANLRSQIVTSSLSKDAVLRSQSVTLKDHGGLRYLPWVFTEHGALMAAMILRSERAVSMSVFVVRAFVQMREQIGANLGVLRRRGCVWSRFRPIASGSASETRMGAGPALPSAARPSGPPPPRSPRPSTHSRSRWADIIPRHTLAEIDKKLLEHDVVLREVVERLSPLLNPPPEDDAKKPKIGYHRGNR